MPKHQANSLPLSIRRRRRWGLVLEIIIFSIITGLILIDLVPAVLSLLGHRNMVPALPENAIPGLSPLPCKGLPGNLPLRHSSSDAPGSPADASRGDFGIAGRLEYNVAISSAKTSVATIL